jgi:hypothetical protein
MAQSSQPIFYQYMVRKFCDSLSRKQPWDVYCHHLKHSHYYIRYHSSHKKKFFKQKWEYSKKEL